MKLILFFTISLLSLSIQAQVLSTSYDSKEFVKVKNSTTMFVMVGDTTFDNAVKRSAAKYWKFTKHDFVSIKNIDEVIKDESKSFMLPLTLLDSYCAEAKIDFSDNKQVEDWYALLPGGKEKLHYYRYIHVIAYAPFNYFGDEKKYTAAAYRIDYLIKGINDILEIAEQKNLTGTKYQLLFKSFDIINENAVHEITVKTLVINKDVKNWANKKPIATIEAFQKAGYAYKYKFVSKQEFKQIMVSDSKEYLCFFPAIQTRKNILIFDPSTRKTVYYGWSSQGLKVKKKNIKAMMEGKS